MSKIELEALTGLLEKLAIVFGLLVAIGVTGESVTGFLLWRRNSDMKVIQERELAELHNEAAKATKRAAELQLLIEPRELNGEQQEALSAVLKHLAGRNLLIGSHWNDAESARLARLIKIALNRAGIGIGKDSPRDVIGKYPEIPVGLFGGGTVTGVDIHEGVEVWGADREAVATALRSIGKFAVTTPEGPSPFNFDKPGLITLFVGVKPVPEVK